MNRRLLFKNLVLISIGNVFLPSCFQENNKSSLAFKNIRLSEKEVGMLAAICDTILPKTDTQGAKDVGAHIFALMMIDDCFDFTRQQKFMKGLEEFKAYSQKKSGKVFSANSLVEKIAILKEIQFKNDVSENEGFFYNTMKSLTLQAYTSSQYFLTKVHEYKQVGGKSIRWARIIAQYDGLKEFTSEGGRRPTPWMRMGNDPKTSLLNKWNQFHNCSNVFVTDGDCMTSTSTQNPSLTYMAFTARAVDYAVT